MDDVHRRTRTGTYPMPLPPLTESLSFTSTTPNHHTENDRVLSNNSAMVQLSSRTGHFLPFAPRLQNRKSTDCPSKTSHSPYSPTNPHSLPSTAQHNPTQVSNQYSPLQFGSSVGLHRQERVRKLPLIWNLSLTWPPHLNDLDSRQWCYVAGPLK